MRVDPDTCRDPDLLAAEVRRLQAVIADGRCRITPAITCGEEETMTEPNETAKPSGASGGSDSYVPVWADDLGREIACYLWGISALRHGLTMPGDFIPCVSAALRAGFANGQIRLPSSTPQVSPK